MFFFIVSLFKTYAFGVKNIQHIHYILGSRQEVRTIYSTRVREQYKDNDGFSCENIRSSRINILARSNSTLRN